VIFSEKKFDENSQLFRRPHAKFTIEKKSAAMHHGIVTIPPLVQAVELQRNSDAEAWSHRICIAPKNMATATKRGIKLLHYLIKQYILHLQKQIILKLS
jgi:hypothetical protein